MSWGSYMAKVAGAGKENEKSVFYRGGVGWGAVLRGSVCRQLRIVR